MNRYILDIVSKIGDKKSAERSIQDLRLLIERYTMNRYSKDDEHEYMILFSDQSLLHVRLTQEDINAIKIEIFYMILRYSEYSVLFAKCIKVFFDSELWGAIRKCIYAYINEDDTICELIFAITDTKARWEQDEANRKVLIYVSKNGGEQSRRISLDYLSYISK